MGYRNEPPEVRIYPVGASQTIKQGYFTYLDTDGYAVCPADCDVASYKFAGIAKQDVVTDASYLNKDGKVGEVEVAIDGIVPATFNWTSGTTYIGRDLVYADTPNSVQSATDATNDVFVGKLVDKIDGLNTCKVEETARYFVADGYCLVELFKSV